MMSGMNAEIPGSSSGLASLQRFGCYVSTNGQSILLPPAQGTFGTMEKALFSALHSMSGIFRPVRDGNSVSGQRYSSAENHDELRKNRAVSVTG
jgi:hypothetical protein